MKSEFRATTPADAPALADFLGRIFEASPDDPVVDPRMMHWKYWNPRPGWPGSRSYVLERAGTIVAHAAAWPSTILSGPGIPCFFLTDWAASPDFPGAGVSIMKRMTQIVPVIFLYGGTEVACKVRAAMGYRSANDVQTLALPLRPLRQLLSSNRWNWKTPARLARNFSWSLRKPRASSDWRAQLLDPAKLDTTSIPWRPAASAMMRLTRDPELFRDLAACPRISLAFYLALRNAQPAGYFCLTFPPGQARIADAWTPSEDVADWASLYALAVQEAARTRGVNEIAAASTGNPSLAALTQCGFHSRAIEPVQLYDPQGRAPTGVPLEVQLLDGDAAFRSVARPDYLT